MSEEVQHLRDAQRFELVVEGHRCELDYHLSDGVMTITHTGVPPAVEGRGLASRLVGAAFAAADAQGWKVRPACSYAAVWAQRHPEVAHLLA